MRARGAGNRRGQGGKRGTVVPERLGRRGPQAVQVLAHLRVGIGSEHPRRIAGLKERSARLSPAWIQVGVPCTTGNRHLRGHRVACGHRGAARRVLEGAIVFVVVHALPYVRSSVGQGSGHPTARDPKGHCGQQQARASMRRMRRSRSSAEGNVVNCTAMRRGPGSSSWAKTRTTTPFMRIGLVSAGG